MIPDDLAEFVRSYERTWNTHDGSALAAPFAPDADLIMGADPRAGRFRSGMSSPADSHPA